MIYEIAPVEGFLSYARHDDGKATDMLLISNILAENFFAVLILSFDEMPHVSIIRISR